MFQFFKRKQEKQSLPEWASFFKENEYDEFLNAIEDYFKKRKLNYKFDDGVVIVENNELGYNNLGLTNVSQMCKQNELTHYKTIVSDFFDSMARSHQFETEFNKIVSDYDKVKEYIGVRLYPNDYLAQIGKENTIGKDFSGDIYAMVVYDLPDTVMNIQPAHFKVWNKTLDEVLEEGIKNIKSKYTSRITQEKFGEFKIWFVNGDHFFAPNIVFDFHNQKHLIGSKGALIGIPHRHSVIIYPIENLEVVKVVNAIVPAIYGMNQEGPGSISNNLFWYSNGQFENLPYTIENSKFQFHPTENFVEILNTLEIG